MVTGTERESLLKKFVWQMTGEEFLLLHKVAEGRQEDKEDPVKLIYGVHDLSIYIGCCESTIYELKKKGVLDDAIVSHIGRKIVFDGNKARLIADEYIKGQRKV